MKKLFFIQQRCFIIFNAVLQSEFICWFQMHPITKEVESRLNQENTKQNNVNQILVPSVINPCIQPNQINSSLSHTDLTDDEGKKHGQSLSFIQWISFPESSTAFIETSNDLNTINISPELASSKRSNRFIIKM